MKRLMTWLKQKAREWCAPEHEAVTRRLAELIADQVRQDHRTVDAMKEAHRLRELLRTPFEARETDSAPPWGNEDANNWRKFLASTTGERLRRLVNYWTQLEAQKAAMRPDKHEYACGLAAGWWNEGDFILNKLSADLPLQTEGDTEQGKGAAGYRERVAP